MSFRLAYIVSHPIQYQAPLLRHLSRAGGIDLQVFFLSDFSLRRHYERPFNQTFKWDVSLIDGYKSEILPRPFVAASATPRPWWPVGGLRHRLREGRFDAVWVHGWGHLGLNQAVNDAAALGIPVLLRGESAPEASSGLRIRKRLRKTVFLQWLFRRVAGFLCIGSRNYDFYRQWGVSEDRLFAVPYAVDNDFFQAGAADARPRREKLRNALSLEPGRPIILFAGKFIHTKGPDELLKAFTRIQSQAHGSCRPYLLCVGDGPLRKRMEEQAAPMGEAVRFLGFRNQTELPALYDLCDVVVVPSRFEPWGLVVNEVMNAARPIIASDRVGAAPDLVVNGGNGFVYQSGDVATLAGRLQQILLSPALRVAMGEQSLRRINNWDFAADHRGLLHALSSACRKHTTAEGEIAG